LNTWIDTALVQGGEANVLYPIADLVREGIDIRDKKSHIFVICGSGHRSNIELEVTAKRPGTKTRTA